MPEKVKEAKREEEERFFFLLGFSLETQSVEKHVRVSASKTYY